MLWCTACIYLIMYTVRKVDTRVNQYSEALLPMVAEKDVKQNPCIWEKIAKTAYILNAKKLKWYKTKQPAVIFYVRLSILFVCNINPPILYRRL